MLRADMDALPQQELTGLPYASKKKVVSSGGEVVPVMHACGHDLHVVMLLAAGWLLSRDKGSWRGTLVCLFQPAEESGSGAQSMINGGLFDRIPHPDVLLGQHVVPTETGTVQIRAGPTQSSCDTFDVRIVGKGGHGSRPQVCRDPVITACSIVLRLQAIVSREIPPEEFAVVTCAYIHAGRSTNIIPDCVDMKIDVRAYKNEIRETVIAAVKRIIRAECDASAMPQEPEIVHVDSIPAVFNDSSVVERVGEEFGLYFRDRLGKSTPSTASDDFSVLGATGGIPYAYWHIGGTDVRRWEEAERDSKLEELPMNHSPYFAPAIEPTLKTGVQALVLGALAYLHHPSGP
jgi:amidohydrolase